jgi:hypothetical protein
MVYQAKLLGISLAMLSILNSVAGHMQMHTPIPLATLVTKITVYLAVDWMHH